MRLNNVVPCKDYVLVSLPDKYEELATKSGIAVAGAATAELLPCTGSVLLVGEGRRASSGELTPSPCKIGDEIKFRDYAGQDVSIEGKDYVAVRMVDILSVSDK